MQQLTIRLSDETREHLRTMAMIEGRTMADIVREMIQERIDANEELKQVAQAIAKARAKRGPISEDEAREAAIRAARMDDAEGLGETRIERQKPRKQ